MKSLRTWASYFVVIGVVAAMVIAAAAAWFSWIEQKGRVGVALEATSRAITASVDREFDETVALGRGLATSRYLQDDDYASFDKQAREVLEPYGYWLVLNPVDS